MLNCDYIFYGWAVIPNSYTCDGKVLYLGDEKIINEVSRNHLEGKTNNDVIGLWIRDQRVGFIPLFITSFFPNLKLFTISNCGLKTVSSLELKQFGLNLESLGFHENELEQVDHDLLEFTPNLKWIAFRGNKIRNIGLELFKSSLDLYSIQLGNNFCISKDILHNSTAIKDFIFEISLKCPPNIHQLERQLFSRNKFETKIDEQVSERMNPLVYMVYQLEKQNQQQEERLSLLEDKMKN
jgi:hypothetical protein